MVDDDGSNMTETVIERRHTIEKEEINDDKVDFKFQYDLPADFKILEDSLNNLFKLERRCVGVRSEFIGGFVQFISCCYVLPVIPKQLSMAGYPSEPAVVITAICCGIGSIVGGLVSNLPFVVAPPTAVSIFLSVYLRQKSNMDYHQGGLAVIVSGLLLLGLGYRPLGRLFKRLIPHCIQVSSAVGIGLLVALAGCTDINLVVTGKFTILDLGPLTAEVQIALCGFIMTGVLLHYHFKGAFAFSLVFCSIVSWIQSQTFPASFAEIPHVQFHNEFNTKFSWDTAKLATSLVFLYIICLNGLSRAFADLSKVTNENGRGGVPRGRWLYIICGVMTIFSGFYGGPPILISPESAAGIKAGARTGLSTVVAGLFFCISVFFAPLFENIPNAGTAPILISIGVLLFVNVKKLDWADYRKSFPAFAVLIFIPFTYNILYGVLFGYLCYISIGIFSGDLLKATKRMVLFYAPTWHDRLFELRKSDLMELEFRESEVSVLQSDLMESGEGDHTRASSHSQTALEEGDTVSEDANYRRGIRQSLLTVLKVFSWKKFWRTLWEELFSFDDKDVVDEPVDFGHSAFTEESDKVKPPPMSSGRTTSTGGSDYDRGHYVPASMDDYDSALEAHNRNRRLLGRNRARTMVTPNYHSIVNEADSHLHQHHLNSENVSDSGTRTSSSSGHLTLPSVLIRSKSEKDIKNMESFKPFSD